MKKYQLIIILLVITFSSYGQKERKFIRDGNGFFKEGLKDTVKLDSVSFGKAEVAYRRALQIKPDDFQWQFNLADAIYKQGKPEEAATAFEDLIEKEVYKIPVPAELGEAPVYNPKARRKGPKKIFKKRPFKKK